MVTSIRIVTIDGNGKDLGFSEIEVYPARTGNNRFCWLGGSLYRIDTWPVYILHNGFPAFRDDIGGSAYHEIKIRMAEGIITTKRRFWASGRSMPG